MWLYYMLFVGFQDLADHYTDKQRKKFPMKMNVKVTNEGDKIYEWSD